MTLTRSSLRCIQVIAGVLGRAGEAGQKQRLALAQRGNITYQPAERLVLPEALQEKATAAAAEAGILESSSIDNPDDVEEKLDQARNRELSTHAARSIKKTD